VYVTRKERQTLALVLKVLSIQCHKIRIFRSVSSQTPPQVNFKKIQQQEKKNRTPQGPTPNPEQKAKEHDTQSNLPTAPQPQNP
jgi:hypothetical protein